MPPDPAAEFRGLCAALGVNMPGFAAIVRALSGQPFDAATPWKWCNGATDVNPTGLALARVLADPEAGRRAVAAARRRRGPGRPKGAVNVQQRRPEPAEAE